MDSQLPLIDTTRADTAEDSKTWRLADDVCRRGLRGVSQARAELADARLRTAIRNNRTHASIARKRSA